MDTGNIIEFLASKNFFIFIVTFTSLTLNVGANHLVINCVSSNFRKVLITQKLFPVLFHLKNFLDCKINRRNLKNVIQFSPLTQSL